MNLRSLLVKIGVMSDPEEDKRAAELRAKLEAVDGSLTKMQRKIAEASVRTARNNRRLTQTMGEHTDLTKSKNAIGTT